MKTREMDKSNGYERLAGEFIEIRGRDVQGIGALTVKEWVKTLTPESSVLDLGCGTGIPISKVLVEQGMRIYGVDASVTMVQEFQKNFPKAPVACEAVEESQFFNRRFDAIIAWGLIFLLSENDQKLVIQKAADALVPGGKLLFTAPYQECEWEDIMTGQISRSLGAGNYKKILSASGFGLIEEFEDEVGNHYFNSTKV